MRFFCGVVLRFDLRPQVRDVFVRVSHNEHVEVARVSVAEN